MIVNAKIAHKNSLDSLRNSIQHLISEASNRHEYLADIAWDMPDIILKELEELGYKVTKQESGWLTISWEEV